MKRAKETDEKKPPKVELRTSLAVPVHADTCKPQRSEDQSSKVIQFHIMKNPTDPQPIVVRREYGPTDSVPRYLIPVTEVLGNDSKLKEIIWNFSRFPHESGRRLTLSQSPHFYDRLLTSSNADWHEFDADATEENWHSHQTEPICVLTNTQGRVFLELGQTPRAFDNVWDMNETLVFKSRCFAFFSPPF